MSCNCKKGARGHMPGIVKPKPKAPEPKPEEKKDEKQSS